MVATRDPQEQGTALRWALNALNRLAEESKRFTTDEEADDEGAFVNAVQAAWWVASIDEQLQRQHRTRYPRRRRKDPDGLIVAGIRWIRDRHTHQVPITTGRDETPFFPGPPFYLVAGSPQWLPSSAVAAPDLSDLTPGQKRTYTLLTKLYDEHVAGKTVVDTLRAALRWFDSEADRPGNLLHRAAQVNPGLHADAIINRRQP
jgi:hypothetical protein